MDTARFIDGLGRRSAETGPGGERLERLRLCAEIASTPEHDAALLQRASTLARFDHPSFARVRRIDRHGEPPRGALAVVSDAVDGVRLSDLLRESERRYVDRDLEAGLHLLEQAVAALAALHQHAPDVAHGALGPERLVVRRDGTVVVVEHVLGEALESLEYSRLQLWALFRVPAPLTASMVRLDQQADVLQLGALALALLLGRTLRREEFPHGLPAVLDEAAMPDPGRNYAGCSRPIRGWIGRALQFEPRIAFRSAVEAWRALAAALREDRSCTSSPAAVQRFLAGCSFESLGPPPESAEFRVSASGAVVSVRSVDRGSGAHRVSRQAPVDADRPTQTLADFGAAGSAPAPSPSRWMPPLVANSRQ
jgi:hypothetical protein